MAPRFRDVPRNDDATDKIANLDDPRSIGRQWELTRGETVITDAIAQAAAADNPEG